MSAPAIPVAPRRTTRSAPARLLTYLALGVTTIISLFPFYWLVITAFTPTQSSIKIPPDFIPVHASLENFTRLFQQEIGEHTSELQSQFHLVCRLLLEKKNTTYTPSTPSPQSSLITLPPT